MGLKEITVSILLIGLFSFALISFGLNMQLLNNAPVTLLNDSTINSSYGLLNNSYSQYQKEAQERYNASAQDNPQAGSDSILTFSIVNNARSFTTGIFTIFGIIMNLIINTLTINPIIIGVFSGLLIFIVILYTWRLFRGGE